MMLKGSANGDSRSRHLRSRDWFVAVVVARSPRRGQSGRCRCLACRRRWRRLRGAMPYPSNTITKPSVPWGVLHRCPHWEICERVAPPPRFRVGYPKPSLVATAPWCRCHAPPPPLPRRSVPPSALYPNGATLLRQVAATYVVPSSARSSRQAPPTVPGRSSVPPCADAAPDGVGVSRPAHVSQQWLKAASGKRSRRIIVSLLQDDPCPPRHVDGGTFGTTSSSLPTTVGPVGTAVDTGPMVAQRRDASFALLQAGHWVRWAPACQGGAASGGGPPALTCLDALISTDLVVLGDLQPGPAAECAKRSREDACGLTSALIRPPGWQPSLFRHVRVRPLGPFPMGVHADHNAVATPMHSVRLGERRHWPQAALSIAPSCGDASNNTSSTAGSHIEGGMLDVDALLDALDGRDVCEGDQRYSPIHQRRPMSDHRLHHSDDGASAGPPPPPPSTVDNRIMSRRGLLASAKLFAPGGPPPQPLRRYGLDDHRDPAAGSVEPKSAAPKKKGEDNAPPEEMIFDDRADANGDGRQTHRVVEPGVSTLGHMSQVVSYKHDDVFNSALGCRERGVSGSAVTRRTEGGGGLTAAATLLDTFLGNPRPRHGEPTSRDAAPARWSTTTTTTTTRSISSAGAAPLDNVREASSAGTTRCVGEGASSQLPPPTPLDSRYNPAATHLTRRGGPPGAYGKVSLISSQR